MTEQITTGPRRQHEPCRHGEPSSIAIFTGSIDGTQRRRREQGFKSRQGHDGL